MCLVSSAQTTSACCRTFNALMVMSSKLPIGVATIYKCPGKTVDDMGALEDENLDVDTLQA